MFRDGRDSLLVGRELVIIIVMRDVFHRCHRLINVKARGTVGCGRGLGDALDFGRLNLATPDGVERSINRAGGDGAGGEDSGADEIPAIEIDRRRRDLAI